MDFKLFLAQITGPFLHHDALRDPFSLFIVFDQLYDYSQFENLLGPINNPNYQQPSHKREFPTFLFFDYQKQAGVRSKSILHGNVRHQLLGCFQCDTLNKNNV